jgi:hypothetical protein
MDFSAGFDLQGKVEAEAGSSGVGGSFAAGVDVSGALAVQAELPIDLFSSDGAGLIARLRAKLAATAFVSAALTLDRGVLEQGIKANFGEPMSSLLDIVLDELDVEAGLWGRASFAAELLGEAVLAGTLLPSADDGAGFTFSTCYDTAFGYGSGVHFLANIGFAHPQRLFTRLTGEMSDQLLALVTPSDPDELAAVSVGLGALHTLLPVAVRGLLQLGMSLADGQAGASQTATTTLAASLIAQGQQVVLQAVTDLATGLLSDALTDARLVSALSRITSAQLSTTTGQLTTLENNFQALTETAISDIDQWLAGLLTCLDTISNLLSSLTGFGVAAEITAGAQSSAAMLWAAGTLLERIISWADDASAGSPFTTDAVTPSPPASVAATIKASGGSVTYSDVVAYLLGSQVANAGLETVLRAAFPPTAAAFDWLNTVLQITPGQLLQTLLQDLAAPTAQQAALLITQLSTAADDAWTNHILPELLDPLEAAAAADANLTAFVQDVVKPGLAAVPQVILPALAGLGSTDALTRIREVISALLLHTIEHFMATTLKALVDHAMTAAEAALNQAAADVKAAGAASPVFTDIMVLAAVVVATCSEVAVLVPTPNDVANILTLAGTIAADLQQLADDLFALVDELMQFGLGSDSTLTTSLQALANSDLPVDQQGLSQALSTVENGALKTAGDVLSDLPTLAWDHLGNEIAAFGQVIDQAAGKVVQAFNDAINTMEHWAGQVADLIQQLVGDIRQLLDDLGQALIRFGQYVQTLIQQAVEAVRQAGLQIIYSLMGGPPHSWAQHAIVDLYNTLFDALEGLADLLAGILGAAATTLGTILEAAAGGAHVTPDSADAAVQQGLLAASGTDLTFGLKVTAWGVTVLDLGTVTISAGAIGGAVHDLLNSDTTLNTSYQSTLQNGVQTATQAAGFKAQQATAQAQAATATKDLTNLKATVASLILPAAPTVQILTPVPGTALPFGARVLITVSGVNRTFTEPTLGMAPRIVIYVNGLPWSYQASDWWQGDPQDPTVLILQADLVATQVPAFAPPAAATLTAQSTTTTPGVTATYNLQTGQLELQPVPGSRLVPDTPTGTISPDIVTASEQPAWAQRAMVRQALLDPAGVATGELTGQGRVIATAGLTQTQLPAATVPLPLLLATPAHAPLVSSTPVMVGKFGINTIGVAVADGAGHIASATTTVVIHFGGSAYAVSAKHSGSCLTIAGGETVVAPGASAQQWPWAGDRNQMWKVQPAQPTGSYTLAADHSGLPLGVNLGVPTGDYDNWRLCAKCQGLFLNDGSAPTTCAGGGTHDPAASPDYFLAKRVTFRIWTQCTRCSCLFQDIIGQASVCPAGGAHTAQVAHWGDPGITPDPGSPNWQWCGKCGMLVPAGGGTGVCPASGGHDTTGSQTVVLPAADRNGIPLAQGEPSGPWQLLPAPDPRYQLIQRQQNGKVAEVAGSSAADGAAIDQWDWASGDNQQWRLTPVPEIDPAAYYTITAKHSGKVLEVRGGPTATQDGAPVDQASGTGQASQRWRFLPNSDSSYTIAAEHSGSCLSVPLASISMDGTPLQQWHPLPWTQPPAATPGSALTSWADATYQHVIYLDGSGHVHEMFYPLAGGAWGLNDLTAILTAPPAAPGSASVEQSPTTNSANQRWRLQPAGAGAYALIPQDPKTSTGGPECLDLVGGSLQDGAPIQLANWSDGSTQQWQIQPFEPGCYKIQNLASGKVIEVAGGPSAVQPGTPVQQSSWVDGDNQKWRLTR